MDGGGFRYERIVTLQVPIPLTLLIALLEATGQWHLRYCERPNCDANMFSDANGNWEVSHRWSN